MKKLSLVPAHTMALALLLALSLSAFAQKGGTNVDAGSGSGAGLSSDVMDIAAGQTARLELKNTGEESVAVRLQFVDPEGKVLVQRDATIEAGGDDALDYPNNPPAGVTAKNPKGPHVNIRAQFETKGAKSIGWLRPALHIIEDGKTIQLIEQNGFKEVRDVIPSDSTAIVGADSSNQIIVYGFTTAELSFNAQIATARLTVHNKSDAPVAVRLQFVDKEEKVLVQRDATIKPGGDEALAFGNNPVDFPFTGGSAGRMRAQFGTTEPNGFLEPSLRIVENASGKIIESIGQEGFKEFKPSFPERGRLIGPPVVTPKVPPLKSGNGPGQPNSGNRAEVLGAAENAKHVNPFQTTQVQSERAQGARVTEAFLKADDGRMSGTCPIKVVFNGYITVDGPGIVAYTFTRSDGATAPVLKMEFEKAGTQQVTTDWTLGDVRTLPSYEGWQAIKILSPNELESSHETGAFSIKCIVARAGRGEQTGATNVSGNVKGASAGNAAQQGPTGVIPSVPGPTRCYQVALNGFSVNHATADNALRRDGVGDEVFLNYPTVLRFDARGGITGQSLGGWGDVYGEVRAGEVGRRQGGGATPNGGFQTGDKFPTQTPWRRESPFGGIGIPYRFFSGPLRPGELLLVIPSLWEWDGPDNHLTEHYQEMIGDLRGHISSMISTEGYEGFVRRVLSGGSVPVVKTFSELNLQLSVSIGLDPFNPGPRPIGMRLPRGQGDLAFFDPQILFLTPEAAEYMTTNNAYRLGAGVMPFHYRDDPDLEGDYTLYVQTESADCNDGRP